MVDKVFVAEDEEDILKLVKMILEKAGYHVVSASNGLDAELRISEELPDIALLDVVMPKKGGFEVCKALKTMKKTQHIPIIMFTVLGRDVDKKMSADAGADGHFTKPFEPEKLISEIMNGIKKSKQDRFSRSLEVSKNQISGRKMLFEYDSKTSYESVVRDFLLERKCNCENSVILTHESSAIHNTMKDEEGIKIEPFTLPIVLSPLLGRYSGQKLRFVFDSLSDMMLSIGFQSTYNFVRDTLPKLAGNNVTALFLLNPESHEAREVESIRNLFRDQLEYTAKGIRTNKLS